jgi:hypothetical protein
MAVLSTISFVVGVVLGLKFKVLILVPAIGFAAAIISAGGVANGESIWHLTLAVAVAAISVQVGYLGGTVLRHILDAARARLRSRARERQAARNAVGRTA